jgi:hypothetical protein
MGNKRRRRQDPPVQVNLPPLTAGAFDPDEWVEDCLGLLDYVRDTKPEKRVAHEGRWRAQRYLASLQRMLGDHPAFKDHAVRGDLAILALALDGLDNYVEHEIVRKRKGANKPPETKIERQFRLLILQMVDCLIQAGMERGAAYKFLAAAVTSAGQGALKPPSDNSPNPPFNPGTIKRWYEATRFRHEKGQDAERPDDALWLFWRKLDLAQQTVAEAQESVRLWLAQPVVKALFPKCLKTGV